MPVPKRFSRAQLKALSFESRKSELIVLVARASPVEATDASDASNVKPIANNGERNHMPTAARRFQGS